MGAGAAGTLDTNRIFIFPHFLLRFRQVTCFVQLYCLCLSFLPGLEILHVLISWMMEFFLTQCDSKYVSNLKANN